MDILGIGPLELVVILIVALLVFGPNRLPEIGAKLGRGLRDMRRATRALSEELNETRRAVEEPAREIAKPFKDIAQSAKQVAEAAETLRHPGLALQQDIRRTLLEPPANTPVPDAAPDEKPVTPPIDAAELAIDAHDPEPADLSPAESAAPEDLTPPAEH